MNYDLAKELKDAGFPQTNGHLIFAAGITLADNGQRWSDNSACLPTLTELIEACGDGFVSLTRETHFTHRTGFFLANKKHSGPTPEEAVARLWLALNKK